MSETISTDAPARPRKPFYKDLTVQVLAGVVAGVLVGTLAPSIGIPASRDVPNDSFRTSDVPNESFGTFGYVRECRWAVSRIRRSRTEVRSIEKL
jgi:hypothetical protein